MKNSALLLIFVVFVMLPFTVDSFTSYQLVAKSSNPVTLSINLSEQDGNISQIHIKSSNAPFTFLKNNNSNLFALPGFRTPLGSKDTKFYFFTNGTSFQIASAVDSPPQIELGSDIPQYVDEEGDDDYLTEEEELMVQNGIDINYDFNETLSDEWDKDTLISAPGCPPSGQMEGYKLNRDIWVHFGNPPKCFLTGTQGPCPENMAIGINPGDVQKGVCKCSCFTQFEEGTFSMDSEESVCFMKSINQLVADYEGTCHKLLSQGPCKPNELFSLDFESKTPFCETRVCINKSRMEGSNATDLNFPFKGACLALGVHCNGTDSKFEFTDSVPIPSCYTDVDFGNFRPPVADTKSVAPVDIPGFSNKQKCSGRQQKRSRTLKRCVYFQKREGRSNSVG